MLEQLLAHKAQVEAQFAEMIDWTEKNPLMSEQMKVRRIAAFRRAKNCKMRKLDARIAVARQQGEGQ